MIFRVGCVITHQNRRLDEFNYLLRQCNDSWLYVHFFSLLMWQRKRNEPKKRKTQTADAINKIPLIVATLIWRKVISFPISWSGMHMLDYNVMVYRYQLSLDFLWLPNWVWECILNWCVIYSVWIPKYNLETRKNILVGIPIEMMGSIEDLQLYIYSPRL